MPSVMVNVSFYIPLTSLSCSKLAGYELAVVGTSGAKNSGRYYRR